MRTLFAVVLCMDLNIDRWDIGNGHRERGRKTLAIFRARGDINHPDVIAEYEEIIAAVGTFAAAERLSFWDGVADDVQNWRRNIQREPTFTW